MRNYNARNNLLNHMKQTVPNQNLDQASQALMGVANELECAIQQAEALNQLFEHALIHPGDATGFGDDICCGFVELSAATFGRLRRASAAVAAHATIKR